MTVDALLLPRAVGRRDVCSSGAACAQSKRKSGTTILLQYCRSYWAFEHSGLNFDQRLGFCLRSQPERPRIFIAHQMNSVVREFVSAVSE